MLLIWVDPYIFGSYSMKKEVPLIMMVAFSSVVIPGIAIAMMKGLGLVKTMEMESHKERIIPLIAVMVCYFSLYMFVNESMDIPDSMKIVTLGTCISLALSFMINTIYKISLHGVGVGALWIVAMYMTKSYATETRLIGIDGIGYFELGMLSMFIIITIIAGLVMTSRLVLKSHTKDEIYLGFILGMSSQIIAYLIYQLWN